MYRVPDIEELQAENERLKSSLASYHSDERSRWYLERDLEQAHDTIKKLREGAKLEIPWWVPLLPFLLGVILGCEILQTYCAIRGL